MIAGSILSRLLGLVRRPKSTRYDQGFIYDIYIYIYIYMQKMAAPSGLLSGYFIGPSLLNQSSDFKFVITVIFRKNIFVSR